MSVAHLPLDMQRLTLYLLLACSPVAGHAQLVGDGLPISLDADSSEFDRKNNVMVFRGVSIRQGALTIRARLARSTELDFKNAEWVFSGQVVITGTDARLEADSATLRFVNHDLKNARIVGQPAAFEQKRNGETEPVRGRSSVMEYDLVGQLIKMSGSAWLQEGKNEILGEMIAYNISEQRVIATSDESGSRRVQITITPDKKPALELPDLPPKQ